MLKLKNSDLMATINFLESKDLKWINISRPGKREIDYLKKSFNFREEDLKDCLPPLQRPKFQERPEYLFMILLFPVYSHKTKEIKPSEVDLFIGKNFLITVHSNELLPLIDLFKKCGKDKRCQEKIMTGNPGILLYELLNGLLDFCLRMLVHISNDLEKIKENVLNPHRKETIEEILKIKTNIVSFRKAMQGHQRVISQFLPSAQNLFSTFKLNIYFQKLKNSLGEIEELLNNFKETIDAFEEAHSSIISFRINEVMKALNIFAVIVFPLTLFAAIFGMNTMGGMPFLGNPYGFWIVTGVMLLTTFVILLYFKTKKWMD